ncbi:uncharacterized protein LOC119081659 [Bradysia coprophila]|uniref:uncharacterized protein LOC119081659 n=1 Tax=Bradysia coprophila TaxID=38358 RepID=UPI00187DC7FE|nr:uncharacterized protein LOC119081659 [Bradysia coprophila]
MSTTEVLCNLHPGEQLPDLVKLVLRELKSLHVSCGENCLEVTKSGQDFIGICVFYKDGSALLQDRDRRIRSGYIFAEASSVLAPRTGSNTMHRTAYNLIFDKIENTPGILIVGFSQQNRKLKGTSRTFNSNNLTNLLPQSQRDGQCLFSLRTLIFGSIIVHKLNGIRNVTPHSACLAMCLFLIVKTDGDASDLDNFPVADIDLDNQQIFLRTFFANYNVAENILKVAFNDISGVGVLSPLLFGLDRKAEKYTRAKWAMKQLMEGFKADMSPHEFQSFMQNLTDRYTKDSFIGSILYWICVIFGIIPLR